MSHEIPSMLLSVQPDTRLTCRVVTKLMGVTIHAFIALRAYADMLKTRWQGLGAGLQAPDTRRETRCFA
jgi:hypothetical protein